MQGADVLSAFSSDYDFLSHADEAEKPPNKLKFYSCYI